VPGLLSAALFAGFSGLCVVMALPLPQVGFNYRRVLP
jgi:hypothetical protein